MSNECHSYLTTRSTDKHDKHNKCADNTVYMYMKYTLKHQTFCAMLIRFVADNFPYIVIDIMHVTSNVLSHFCVSIGYIGPTTVYYNTMCYYSTIL